MTDARMAERSFYGFVRPDGRVGIRNTVLCLSITGLTGPATRRIATAVHGVHAVLMPYSTGLVGRDREVHLSTLAGLAINPNVAAVLIVSDHAPKAHRLRAAIAQTGQTVETLTLDEVGQDAIALVAEGTRRAARMVRRASSLRRERVPGTSLCIGLKCGRSDPSSGLAANPAIGAFVDTAIDAGSTVIFGEVVEWLGAEAILEARAATPAVGDALRRLPRAREDAAQAAGLDLMGNNPSPTNIEAGISSIEEKSLGGVSKTGERPIIGVLDYAEAPNVPGLFAMDTPSYAPEHLTSLAAAGCQIALFSTGAGNSFVSGLMPTIKISGNAHTVSTLGEQVDVAVADILSNGTPLSEAATRIAAEVTRVAGGGLTWGEILGEGDDVVSRFGAAL